MFPKYFPSRYFPARYFAKGLEASPFYSNKGDIKSRLLKDYSNSGDIQSISGQDYEKRGDIWATILKRKAQQHVSFDYDVETELT